MAIHAQPQLCTSFQGWLSMENACGFSEPFFNTNTTIQHKQERQSIHHQQQQSHSLHHHHQLQQQMNQNVMQYGESFLVPTPGKKIVNNNDQLSVAFSQSLEAQRQELDHYLRLQGENLVLMLEEQRKQQLGMLMRKLESKTITLIRQKDAEIAQAAQSQMELEGLLRKLEMERQEWQIMARENEAMVESLNNTLEELREKACCCISNNAVEDAESCCDVGMRGDRDEQETGESSNSRRRRRRLVLVDDGHQGSEQQQQQRRTRRKMMVCKGCNSRESCMLFLPCRHLCSCKTCEAFLGCCPVCRTIKKASIEALI